MSSKKEKKKKDQKNIKERKKSKNTNEQNQPDHNLVYSQNSKILEKEQQKKG